MQKNNLFEQKINTPQEPDCRIMNKNLIKVIAIKVQFSHMLCGKVKI